MRKCLQPPVRRVSGTMDYTNALEATQHCGGFLKINVFPGRYSIAAVAEAGITAAGPGTSVVTKAKAPVIPQTIMAANQRSPRAIASVFGTPAIPNSTT